jgi:hypothetical protein
MHEMMHFFLKSSLKGISKRRQWLLMAFLPVIIYLLVSAAIADQFIVRQEISISNETLISLSPRAADLRSLQELLSKPGDFFQNLFALSLLTKRLDQRMPSIQQWSPGDSLIRKVEQCLTLDMIGKNILQIAYEGNDREQGETMVAFYSQRLIKQAKDYLAMNPAAVKDGAVAPSMIGRIAVDEKRSLWRYTRLVPALSLFLSHCSSCCF